MTETISEKTPVAPKNNHARKIWLFSAFLLLLGLLWLLYWLFYLQYHETTDDAYANGNMITINSAISGSVVAFFADDTDLVREGQLLVQLDSTDYTIAFDREMAALASVVLQVKQLYDNVLVMRANADSKRTALRQAQFDFDNRSELVDSKAVSNEDFIHAKDNLAIARLNLEQAESQLQMAQDAVGDTSLDQHPLLEQQKSKVRSAYYNLKHCAIFAPATGYIAQRSVDVGEWISPNTPLMAVIPTDYVWVDANFKETQLTYMRLGQPARVWFDLYGSHVQFQGKVMGIASGSGSVFSIIPPQNATGNWIKIVQRLPVRISLDPEVVKKYPTRLGISANVDVNITEQQLPRLAHIPSTTPVGVTKVFDISFDEVNRAIDEVVDKVKGR